MKRARIPVPNHRNPHGGLGEGRNVRQLLRIMQVDILREQGDAAPPLSCQTRLQPANRMNCRMRTRPVAANRPSSRSTRNGRGEPNANCRRPKKWKRRPARRNR